MSENAVPAPDGERQAGRDRPDLGVAVLPLPASGFDEFTYPRYAPLLSASPSAADSEERIAVAAWNEGRPAGLAFLSRSSAENARRLLSIMVSPDLRGKNVGSRLLALAEECARVRGTMKLLAIHTSDLPARAAYESLMRKAGWSAPVPFEFRAAGKAGWSLLALNDWAPFLERLHRRGFAATGWDALTEADREEIADIVKNAVPEDDRDFDPFQGEQRLPIIPELSIVLRRHGEIVGWILGSKGAVPNSVYYSHGYVLPPFQRAGWLACGVREISQRQAESLGSESLCVFETAATNTGMRRFMEQHLKPYSLWTHWRYSCEKRLE